MLKISDDARNRTKECTSNFYCLSNKNDPRCSDHKPLCSVDYFIGKRNLIVKFSNNNEDCPYKVKFGLRYSCSCPVRQEIFERYNI
jgi:hypothetical protein